MTAVVVAVVLFWLAVFLVFFASQGHSPLEFFWGRFEPLPDDLGIWKRHEGGAPEVREERYVLPPQGDKASYLVHQVRYRDGATGEILRVEAERHVPRKRVSSRSP